MLFSLFSAENILTTIEDYNDGVETKEKYYFVLSIISSCISEIINEHHLNLQSKEALSTKLSIYLNSLVNLMTRYQSKNYKSFLLIWKKFLVQDSTEEKFLFSQGTSFFLNYYIEKIDENSSK